MSAEFLTNWKTIFFYAEASTNRYQIRSPYNFQQRKNTKSNITLKTNHWLEQFDFYKWSLSGEEKKKQNNKSCVRNIHLVFTSLHTLIFCFVFFFFRPDIHIQKTIVIPLIHEKKMWFKFVDNFLFRIFIVFFIFFNFEHFQKKKPKIICKWLQMDLKFKKKKGKQTMMSVVVKIEKVFHLFEKRFSVL